MMDNITCHVRVKVSESQHGTEFLHWSDFMAVSISEHKLASGLLPLTMIRFQKKIVKFIVIKD